MPTADFADENTLIIGAQQKRKSEGEEAHECVVLRVEGFGDLK